MATARGVLVAVVVMVVLWVSLDSGAGAPAAPGTSAALIALASLFGVGAWAYGAAGRGERTPSLAGLATGMVLYAVIRLL